MKSARARLEALEERLMPKPSIPYEKMDAISQGIVDVANELRTLDDQGKTAMLKEINQNIDPTSNLAPMSMGDLERMIRSLTVSY